MHKNMKMFAVLPLSVNMEDPVFLVFSLFSQFFPYNKHALPL